MGKLIENFLKLSKKNQLLLVGGVILLIIVFLRSTGIGSNNNIENTNNGIQGNGNSQNSHNNSENTNNGIQGNGNSVDNSTRIYIKNDNDRGKDKPYKATFVSKKGGNFVVTDEWKSDWEPYLNIYKNFVTLPTKKGYLLLNSPDQDDYYKHSIKKNIKVSGYIKTDNGVFYITKYSYVNRNKEEFPKFIYPIK